MKNRAMDTLMKAAVAKLQRLIRDNPVMDYETLMQEAGKLEFFTEEGFKLALQETGIEIMSEYHLDQAPSLNPCPPPMAAKEHMD